MNGVQSESYETISSLSSGRGIINDVPRANYQDEELMMEEPTMEKSCEKPRIRQINIEQLDHGYIVRVGCQTLAIESKETLIDKLTTYITEPNQTERLFYSGKLF